jgi:hypothetical protein
VATSPFPLFWASGIPNGGAQVKCRLLLSYSVALNHKSYFFLLQSYMQFQNLKSPPLSFQVNLCRYSMDWIHWWKLTTNQWQLTDVMSFSNTSHMRAQRGKDTGELCLLQLRGQHNSTTQPTAWWVNSPITDSYYPCSQHSKGQQCCEFCFLCVSYFFVVCSWVLMS